MSQTNRKIFFYSGLALLVAIASVIIPYAYTFETYGLSDQHQAWANFGGYVGGILGPIFSALAFIGVLLTYRAQQAQLQFAEQRATIDELQRQLSITATAIDLTLTQPVLINDEFGLNGKTFLQSEILAVSNHGRDALDADDLLFTYICNQKHIKLLRRIDSQLCELCWCMNEFQVAGGSQKIVDFYRMKFKILVNELNNAYGWEVDGEILKLFPITD
ncbi:hypothetical protein ACVDHJ_04420 [Aeromonas sp. 25-281]